MGADAGKTDCIIALPADQKQIRKNMGITVMSPVSRQGMVPAARRHCISRSQDADNGFHGIEILAREFFQVTPEAVEMTISGIRHPVQKKDHRRN